MISSREKMMKFLHLISKIIFIVCLSILFITTGIAIAFNAPQVYQHSFDKYNIEQVTGIENSELTKAGHQLIDYFNSGDELIDVTVIKDGEPFTLFNEREILHLKDVKTLVILNYALLVFSGIYILGYCAITFALVPSYWHKILHQLILGSLLTLMMIAVIGILALMDFNWLFRQFHLISFANDLWLLDPATDYLIMMFPGGFWLDAVIIVASLAAGLAMLAGISASLTPFLVKKIKNNQADTQ
jgi:integral membrane protein (TIGR01906 family)